MIIHSLTATFGCLNNATLDLSPGLNLIQAPNESGKSTWLAFLRSMFYGFSSRERGALADKNRYLPWNGASMKGRADLTWDGRDIVLVRDTVGKGAPMGRFYAAYDGTAGQVEGMTGQNAGVLLTGVPRAVFERSAFIRQSGLRVDQDAELEKRIAALLSSGEEDTSYMETEQRLRRALNRRRHNKTGLLPQTEAELDAVEDACARLDALRARLRADRGELEQLRQTLDAAEADLALHDRMDRIEAKRELFAARAEAEQAEAEAAALRAKIEAVHLPEAETLIAIKSNAANLVATQVSMNHVQGQVERAQAAVAEAQSAVDANVFSPAEPEEAAGQVRDALDRRDALTGSARRLLRVFFVLLVLAAAVPAGLAASPLPMEYAAYGCAAFCAPLAALAFYFSRKKAAARAAQELHDRFGADSADALDPLLVAYHDLYRRLTACRDEEAQAVASWQHFYQTYEQLSARILEQTASFFPDIENVNQIVPALDAGLKQWKRLQKWEEQAAQARTRCAVLRSKLPDDAPLTAEEEALTRPVRTRPELTALRARTGEALTAVRSRMDRSQGEAAAAGDRAELLRRREELTRTRTALQQEYDALALALDVLGQANETLHSRFSPALGKRAGEIFSGLTGGRYQTVALDRAFHAYAEDGDAIPRAAELLSQGAMDQLYLAVRLAICEQVLPADKQVPLILDDTFANFDETRMAAALDWLLDAARQRQILLFTCQRREGDYLQTAENVRIITLRANRWR